MSLQTIKLALGLLTALALNAAGDNLYVGDTSAEAQTDTLTRGNYSTDLVPYFWDDTTAFDGKRSVRIDWDQKQRFITPHPETHWFDKWLSAANTPDLTEGEPYTFSFYAKASADNYPIGLEMQPSAGWDFYAPGGTYSTNFKLSREWKRYTYTFIPKIKAGALVKGYSAMLSFKNCPVGSVWYDAIQIEKGKTATPYQNASRLNVGVTLNSPDWSNIYFAEDPVIATIQAELPLGPVELQCKVVDYQGQTVKEFNRSINGPQKIELPLDNPRPGWFRRVFLPKTPLANQQLGWFKVTAELSAGGKIISAHSANYIRIAKPVEIVPGIQPFAGIVDADGFDQFAILKKIGAKRVQIAANWNNDAWWGVETAPGKFNWSAIEWQLKRGREFGMVNKLLVNPFNAPTWCFDKDELAKAEEKNSLLVLDSSKHEHWRKFIGELTRQCGDLIDEFELGAEDNGRLGHNDYYISLYPQEVKKDSTGNAFLVGGKPFDDLCAMVKIGADEIRKSKPNMKIGAIRPSRSSNPDSLLFVREMFKKIGKDFNILPADFYFYPYDFGPLIKQRRAKSDELIDIYNEAKKITRELGCDQPIYMSEFGWFPDTRFPDDSIYRREQAETMPKDFIVARIAGYYAFDWFVGFGGVGSIGNYSFTMQQNRKIQSVAAAYSAVARVVENVTESKWITPDSVTRIAIMRKHDGQGVAAVWADKGYKLALASKFDEEVTATDFMGNPIRPSEGQFSLSPAPIYIWHKDFKQLSDALAKAEVELTEFCEIKFRMVTENTGRLQFVNLSNITNIEINAVITANDQEISKVIAVPKGAASTLDLPLSGKSIKVKAKTRSGKYVVERGFGLETLAPIAAGTNVANPLATVISRGDIIPADPWVPWSGPDDLSARITSSWDADNLYLKVHIQDDLHFNKNPASPWSADSVQIAIDPQNDGAFYVPAVSGKALGPDDFEFGLALGDDGISQCVASHGKNICASNNYTITRDAKTKTTIYTLRLAWNELGVKPSAGMVFGMSFVVFDDDTGTGQSYYAPIGGGIAGEKNPALYKKFVLK